MKIFKPLLSVILGGFAMAASAQGGYQDGVDYYNADRFEQAKIILEKTLSDPSTNKGVSYYYLGAIEMRENNPAAAKSFFEKGIAADPKVGYNYVGLGEIALKSGDKKAAEGYFDDALKMDKKDPEVSAAIARAYFNVDPVAYKKQIDKNIAKSLKDSKNMATAPYVLQGDMESALGNIGQAASYYEQAMQFGEETGRVNPWAYVKYANLYNNTTDSNNKQYAIRMLETLSQKAPNSALAQRELAEKYYDAELFSKAAAAYKRYMSNPNHFQQDEQRLCQLLYFDNKNDESLAIAKDILAKDPSNHYMYRMVMVNDKALGNNAEAAEYGKKLFDAKDVTLTSNDYSTYADALAANGNYAEAVAIYEQGYNANPEKNKGMLAEISSVYNDAQQYAKAAEYQQKFVDLGDYKLQDLFTLANRYRNLALSLPEGSAERTEAAKKGIANIDLALQTAADSSKGPLYRNRAVLLQLRDGQEPTQEIVDTYLEMIKYYDLADPENRTKNPDVYKSAFGNLAQFYTIKGQKDEARRWYEELYKIAPDTPGLAEVLKK
mgnify:FL=1